MKAELHARERERLAALDRYEILDTPPEEGFDDIVRVVSAICDTPISLISLVGEGRQWFKSKYGTEMSGSPLEGSICAHALLQPGLLEVQDTLQDKRTADNPFVEGDPKVRFYAGALLETPEGLPLGTICTLDFKPRKLDEKQKALLQLMAKQVMKLLELRRLIATERQAREKSELLVKENEILAREGDHRVMNSLQLVTAVLSLQARGATSKDGKAQLEAARDRVAAIGTVHKHLNLTGSHDEVEILGFLRGLCESLKELAPESIEDVRVEGDRALMPSALASTIGLVVAELVSNSFKYAYKDGQKGSVSVDFRNSGGWTLQVADEGAGVAKNFDPAKGKGVGMKVINALVRRLDAELSVQSKAGRTVFTVRHGAKPE
ncbi:MAG: sensor histidine kinase [Steroidobacteraceae bacterium]